MIIGYIRVSTEQQSMENQKHKLLEYAQNNKIIIDEFIELEISSKKDQKERLLDKVFEKLKGGDTFICTELSRLGRNMLEILNLIEKPFGLDSGYKTNNPTQKCTKSKLQGLLHS